MKATVGSIPTFISTPGRWCCKTAICNRRKANEEYIESLSSNELKIKADEQRLEAMVRQQLKEEFPNIEKSSSYDLLVDAVIHNYKSKQLQATDGAEIN